MNTHGIACSVGKTGFNNPEDVRVVQELLNSEMRRNSRLKAACDGELAEDCACGPMTIAAIASFQSVVMGWRPESCDGRIDPGGKTWTKLNGNVENANAVRPVPFSQEIFGAVAAAGGFSDFVFDPTEDDWHPPMAIPGTAATTTNGKANEPKAFKQGNYATTKLGKGSKTIKQWGCTLCSLTMAAMAIGSRTADWPKDLKPADLTPIKANDILKKGATFNKGSSAMAVTTAAHALGMKAVEYGFGGTSLPTPDDGYSQIIGHLYSGGYVAAHVDYKNKHHKTTASQALGDHWVLLTNASGQGITAIDPAHGTEMTFGSCAPDGRTRTHNNDKAVLFGTSGTAKQLNYAVVRYILLSPKLAKQL